MSILVFQPNGAKSKHGSIAVDGRCFRFSRANIRGYAQEFRCCDSKCPARVLYNSPDDFVVSVDHWACAFDHRKELRSRMRLAKAYEVLQQNLTDPTPKIIEKVQLLLDYEMSGAERHTADIYLGEEDGAPWSPKPGCQRPCHPGPLEGDNNTNFTRAPRQLVPVVRQQREGAESPVPDLDLCVGRHAVQGRAGDRAVRRLDVPVSQMGSRRCTRSIRS